MFYFVVFVVCALYGFSPLLTDGERLVKMLLTPAICALFYVIPMSAFVFIFRVIEHWTKKR